MTPSHPCDFVGTEIIEVLGLSVTKAAKVWEYAGLRFSALVNGKAAVSPEMA